MFLTHPASDTGKQTAEEQKEVVQKEAGTVAETKQPPPPVKEKSPGLVCPSSTAQAQHEASSRLFSPAATLDKAPSIPEKPLAQTLEKPPVTPTSQKRSPCTSPAFTQTLEKLLVAPPPQEKTPSTSPAASEPPEVSPHSHKEKSPTDVRKSTHEREETVSKQHTVKAEAADQRTEPPLPEKHTD